MKHDLTITGFAFRLRPIGDADAGFIISLRNNPKLNQYLHTGSNKLEDQLTWLSEYYQRQGDYYFVIENIHRNCPEGIISIYDIDNSNHHGEWGRWVLLPGSVAAIESAWLIYRVAFELLKLDYLYCRTVMDNAKVVSFHDSCCIENREILPAHFSIQDKLFDAVEHTVEQSQWKSIAPRLEKLSRMTARRINFD